MDFTAPIEALDCSLPDWNIAESDKDEDWTKQWLRYISSHYNQPPPIWNQDSATDNYRPVERGIMNALYYIGKQRNINYNHITQNTDGNTLPVPWIKTKKVKPVIDRLVGNLIQQLGGKEISAKSLSERAQSEKMRQWEDLKFEFDTRIQRKIDEIEARFGARPIQKFADKYNSQEEAQQELMTLKDELEEAAAALGRYVEWSNDFDTTMIEGVRQDYCSSNYMGIYFYVENSKLKVKRVPFWNIIMDISSDDPFQKDARFCGIIERLTIPEIIKRFPELRKNAAKMKELDNVMKDEKYQQGFFNFYNTGGINWWSGSGKDMQVMVMTGYWICDRDTKYGEVENEYKQKKWIKKKEGNGELYPDLYKGTIVGNCYLVDSGYDNNVVRSVYRGSDPELPLKIFNGNTFMGEGVSPIGLVTDLVDMMDALDFKIREQMGRHKGKGYWLNGNKLTGASKEFIEAMGTHGIVVGYPSGEVNAASDNQPPLYPIDMTLDDSIFKYADYWNQMERRLEANLNLNPSVMGSANSAVGLGVQKNNISMSSAGNMGLYRNLFRYNEICLQYSINLAKIVYGSGEGKELGNLIVGERGMNVLQIIKKYLFEDVLITISPRDVITEDVKGRILAMMQAFAQNGLIDPISYIEAEMSETLTQVRNSWTKAIEKKQKREDEQNQMAMQERQQNIVANNQGQLDTVQRKGQLELEKGKQKAITQIGVKDMELSAKEKQTA